MHESLIKYLSGLFDADGSVSFDFRLGRNKTDQYYVTLRLSLSTSDEVDRHGFVCGLSEEYEIGCYSRYGSQNQHGAWIINARNDVERLLPRLIKHMVIKARHAQRMLEKWRECRGILLSKEECEGLKAFSKESRFSDPGPIKPKNRPTWAWLAGYLDGDGCYRMVYHKGKSYKGKHYPQWHLGVSAAAHVGDSEVLWFLQRTFGGTIRDERPSRNLLIWSLGLGPKNASLALSFLPKLAKHTRLKRHKIDQMIHYHHQRLSVPTPAGEATV